MTTILGAHDFLRSTEAANSLPPGAGRLCPSPDFRFSAFRRTSAVAWILLRMSLGLIGVPSFRSEVKR